MPYTFRTKMVAYPTKYHSQGHMAGKYIVTELPYQIPLGQLVYFSIFRKENTDFSPFSLRTLSFFDA